MTLIEALTLKLAPTIATNIIKTWLRDHKLLQDTASTFVDVLAKRTSDVLAQQRAKRQFEEIGERVAMSLLPIFQKDGSTFDEASLEAICLALTAMIQKGTATIATLLESDLDPGKLTKILLISHPELTRDFSAKECALLERALSETLQYIIDISSQLPSFTERTFAEVLKREQKLLVIANEVLDEVRRIRQQSQEANPKVDAANFEIEYRRAVVRRLDELVLFGVDLPKSSRRHRLSIAYITLSLSDLSGDESTNSDAEADHRILPADQVLAQFRHLLLKGSAGSGKTTFLQWVAVRAASQSFPEPLSGLNDSIPFFIRLRQYPDSPLPPPEDFPKLLAPAITAKMPRSWVHDQMSAGRAIVLIDGVDEIAEQQRLALTHWLRELMETFPHCIFIVTSRHHAIADDWWDIGGFKETELQPMSTTDISLFISHWHLAVKEELQDEEERAQLEKLEVHLNEVALKSRSLRNLATSPLLCAMICALNRDLHQRLPSDRIELYEACIKMLLDRRDLERGVSLASYPQLTFRQKRALLEDFAYWLLVNGWSEIDTAQADRRFQRKLKHMEDIHPQTVGGSVRKLFAERSGIVREPAPGKLDFTHRTFQEFFSAQAALDEEDVGVLINHGHDDQWRETVILAAGLASTKVRNAIIGGLIDRSRVDREHKQQLQLLAVACLEASIELDPKVKAEVQDCLRQLIPPKNMTEAKALSSAGDLAVRYLPQKNSYFSRTAAACVRTLALIGSDIALDAIATYTCDRRLAVTDELWRAWDFLDRTEYARRVVSRMAPVNLEVRSAEGLEYISSLRSLRFLGPASSFGNSGVLNGLKKLSLPHCEDLKDLSLVISKAPKLEELILSGASNLESLEQLKDLTGLTKLQIVHATKLTDWRPLGNIGSLEKLAIMISPQLENGQELPKLNLKRLLLDRLGIRSLEFVIGMEQLEMLYVVRCQSIQNMRPVGGARGLKMLTLVSLPGIRTLDGIEQAAELRWLRFQHMPALDNLNGIAELQNLTRLELIGCKSLTDLTSIAGLKKLTTLNLAQCDHIGSLEPILELPDLTKLVVPLSMREMGEVKDLLARKTVDVLGALPDALYFKSLKTDRAEALEDVTDLFDRLSQ